MDNTKKMIEIKHHKDDYECMWNGIEDLYMDKTGEILPENLFFLLFRVRLLLLYENRKVGAEKNDCLGRRPYKENV